MSPSTSMQPIFLPPRKSLPAAVTAIPTVTPIKLLLTASVAVAALLN